MKKHLSKTEYEIMSFLWENSVNDFGSPLIFLQFNTLSAEPKNWKKQTIATFLKRLCKFGCLEPYVKDGYPRYKVIMSKDSYENYIARHEVNLLLSGSFTSFFTGLSRRERLAKKEYEEINEILKDEENFEER